MDSIYFPVLWLIPEFEEDSLDTKDFSLIKRKWEVSIFDLYSLGGNQHKLGFDAEIMNVFLRFTNMEVKFKETSFERGKECLDILRAAFYVQGLCQCIAPFASNYSINDYAGINDRSSGREDMHEGLKQGITHETACVETFPYELSFSCILSPTKHESLKVDSEMFEATCELYKKITHIDQSFEEFRTARMALIKAPLITDISTSILHLWQGIEALFPDVNTEVTHRISLYLAQLCSVSSEPKAIYKTAKQAYKDRSKITHGSSGKMGVEEWERSWELLRLAIHSVILRETIPRGEVLIEELFSDKSQHKLQNILRH